MVSEITTVDEFIELMSNGLNPCFNGIWSLRHNVNLNNVREIMARS